MSILQDLHNDLNAADHQTRLETVRVIAMVEETHLLAALGKRFKVESEADVREALDRAGRLVAAAKRNGYSTIDEIFRYFGVMRTVQKRSTQEMEQLQRQMDAQLDSDLREIKKDMRGGRIVGGAIAAGFGAALGSSTLAAQGVMPDASSSSNLGGPRESLSTERTPAPRPSTSNIDIWVMRLTSGNSTEDRVRAAKELATLNNPAALKPIANKFATEASPTGQQGLQEQGKLLYWNMVYFDLEQDGTLEKVMEQRARAAGLEYRAG